MTATIPTPRTDAKVVEFARLLVDFPDCGPNGVGRMRATEIVPADFARQLERELTALRSGIELAAYKAALDAVLNMTKESTLYPGCTCERCEYARYIRAAIDLELERK